MRTAKKIRETKETKIELDINLDGSGVYEVDTGILFFNHMLEQFSYHSKIDLKLKAQSIDKDNHHVVEDVAIALGGAISDALADKCGINRYSHIILPMDEALVMAVCDVSGRAFCDCDVTLADEKTSDFETVLVAHFFNSLAQNIKMALHIKMLAGKDTHHIIEATFKAVARAMKVAFAIGNRDEIPSTKGIL